MSFTFMFPFHEIEKGSRIVLYGGGVCGRSLYEQCKCIDYCEIVLWADERWQQLNNQFNKYHFNSIYDLKDRINDIDYAVIAIEDAQIAEEVKELLIEIGIDKDKVKHYIGYVFDDYENRIYIPEERYNNSLVKNIIPDEYKKCKRKKEITKGKNKIRFAASSLNNVIGFETVTKAFLDDDKYDVKVVITGNPVGVGLELERKQLPYMYWYDYDIREDRPDIFFITYGNDGNFVDMNKYAKYVVAIHISIVKWSNVPIEQYIRQVKRQFQVAIPDVYIWDKLIYGELENKGLIEDNYYLIGNPKFDVIYNSKKNTSLNESWKKIKGKKVFLWCTDHVYYCDNITFDIYAKKIIDFIYNNKDLALIFRPHPQFIDELIENNIWSRDDLHDMKEFMLQSDNLIWDDTATYELAYSCCDAILVDSECGIVCSSLPLGVPTAALLRPEKEGIAQEDIVSKLYNVRNINQLVEFFNMVISGEDPLREERKKMVEKTINHYDGKNGERIKEFVENKFLQHQ